MKWATRKQFHESMAWCTTRMSDVTQNQDVPRKRVKRRLFYCLGCWLSAKVREWVTLLLSGSSQDPEQLVSMSWWPSSFYACSCALHSMQASLCSDPYTFILLKTLGWECQRISGETTSGDWLSLEMTVLFQGISLSTELTICNFSAGLWKRIQLWIGLSNCTMKAWWLETE